jgi:hypothetical protein
MSSLIKSYVQRDSRLEVVPLTGFITDNGSIAGVASAQKPAYAEINLTKSKNFSIDTRTLIKRGDGAGTFLVRIFLSSSKPPSNYQNFEFDIFIAPPTGERLILYEMYASQADAEYALIVNNTKIYSFTNEIQPSGDYSTSTGIATFKVLNDSIVIKNLSPNLSF